MIRNQLLFDLNEHFLSDNYEFLHTGDEYKKFYPNSILFILHESTKIKKNGFGQFLKNKNSGSW